MGEELAKLQPEMESAAQNSRQAAETLRDSFCKQQQEFKKTAEQREKQFEKSMREWKRELMRLQQDWL